MNSLPLISHHLFVAAVKQKRRSVAVRKRAQAAGPARQILFQEIPLHAIDFGRPLPLDERLRQLVKI